MSSEKKVCDSCNAIADSDAKFCQECGTALPPIPTNSSELLAQAKIALARADFKGALRACAAAKLLDPNNAKVSQIMATAHAALDVLRDQEPGEGSAAHVQDSNSHLSDEPDEQDDVMSAILSGRKYSRRKWKCELATLLIALVVIIVVVPLLVLDAINGGLEDDGIGSSSNVNTSSQPKPTQTSTPMTPAKVPIVQYEGCDGLEDLIPKLKSIGGSSLGYYQIVQFGDNAMCNDTIEKLNKPELLKD